MDRRAPTPDRPILLVGLPGAGKSTFAPLLAAELGVPSHDSDTLIEAAHRRSVSEFIREDGEPAFRAEERRVVQELLRRGPSVIAAGGGAWLDAEVRSLTSEQAIAIWLDAPLETLAGRLGDARSRPLLAGDVRGKLATLKAARDPVYALASIRVDVARAPALAVATVIAALTEPAR
jgi:shikimate kinase